jgi:tetratricopeptide (TPR) repeat protein
MPLLKEIADPELESRAADIEKYCERKLTDIHRQGLFQYYNDHGPGHSKAVLRLLDDLLEDISRKKGNDMLNEYECFTLYAAAWCHDLGMLKREEEDFKDWGFCEQVRETHPVRTAVYLNDNWKDMGILTKTEAVLLGNICEAHGSSGNVNQLPPKQVIFLASEKYTVRPSFLAALLKLADALDANESRLPSKSYRENPEIPAKSRKEYWKHEVVEVVNVNHKEKEIRVQMAVTKEYPVNVTEEVKKKLKDELKSVKRVLNEYGIDLDFAFSVIESSTKKELPGNRPYPQSESDKTALRAIDNLENLYEVAQDSLFLENKEEDFEAKSKNIFYFGDEQTIEMLSRNIVDKLGSQKILFITGQPGVGKSTLLLFFLDRYIQECIDNCKNVYFLNPRAKDLKKSLGIIDGKIEDPNKNISPKDVLLVIDALHREEEEEEYVDKCYELFTKVLEDKYGLVVTIRDSELAILKEKLGNRYKEFENIIKEEHVNPENTRIKQIFMNYLNYYKDGIEIPDIDLSFEDITKYVQEGEIVSPEKSESYQEFDNCIQKVVEKSEGFPCYVKYLVDDISRKGELSTGIIEKYPAGMTNFTRKIIERDYLIGDDKVLPLLILFLTKEKRHAVTWEFIKSFIEWGFDVIDKGSFDKEDILDRARNLIDYYTVDIHDGIITQYKLISHWREGIEDILKRKEINKLTDIERELGDQILTYLAQKEEELKSGQLPVNLETWLVVADVAKLSYERKKMDVLKYATQFFTEHRDATDRSAFLKNTLSSLWSEKTEEELSGGNYENAVVSIENAIEVDNNDAFLHSLACDCYYEKGELSKALEHSQRAVELKPAEPTYLGKHGRILERVGADFDGKGKNSEAISKFEDAVKSYEKALQIIEGLNKFKKGQRKRESNGYCWRIGYCNKRVELIRMRLRSEDEKYLKDKAEQCFRDGKNYETGGDYDTALKMFVDAKELMSKYIEIKDVFEEDMRNLISSIYRRIAVCYENNRDYEKAAEYYTIHADLNEYAPDSLKMYKEYGNKFRGWELYAKAIYCFTKALKSDQNNYTFLRELADLSARMGKFDAAVKYYKESLEEQKAVIGVVAESDKEWLDKYKKKLEIRDLIGKKLVSICNSVDLALNEKIPEEEMREWLSNKLYEDGMSLGEINPKNVIDPGKIFDTREKEKIRNEIENIKISCLCRAIVIDRNNYMARNELERITGRSCEEICNEYNDYFRRDLEREKENPLGALCRVHSQVISTLNSLHGLRKKGIKKTHVKNRLSGYWGWIGRRINRIYKEDEYVSKISPNVAVKCFELSLKLRKRNKKSSNGLGWALFYAGRYDEAIQAFKADLREDPNNPASKIGIGSVYNKKGDYVSAEKYLREGAKLDFELRYDKDPQRVIINLKKSTGSLEDLAFRCDSRNEKLKLLKEALDVYKMIGEIAQEIKLEDKQNLFKLEAANLEKYISNVEMGVLEDHNI